MVDVGLGYLTLSRQTRTLSSGEYQRITLARALGSALTETLYVLDEPSIGLHARDTFRLLKALQQLRERKNTVVVVEHDPEMIRAADEVIDLGPGAGRLGGSVVFQGTIEALLQEERFDHRPFLKNGDAPGRPETSSQKAERMDLDPECEGTQLKGNRCQDSSGRDGLHHRGLRRRKDHAGPQYPLCRRKRQWEFRFRKRGL